MAALPSLRILLVEDNPSDVLLLQDALDADPLSTFVMTTVPRLADGIRRLQEQTFDIILADLGLPDSSGMDTFERLHGQAPDLPMVIFSGNDDQEQSLLAVRAGAQDYLAKSLSGFDMAARTIRYDVERNKSSSRRCTSVKNDIACFLMPFQPRGSTRTCNTISRVGILPQKGCMAGRIHNPSPENPWGKLYDPNILSSLWQKLRRACVKMGYGRMKQFIIARMERLFRFLHLVRS
jgi:CheY-like chemotaxis protein